MSTLDNLKKTAKRWLKALRSDDAEARSRMNRAHPGAPKNPNLRDVQHALAREQGHESWIELRKALDFKVAPDLERYERLVQDLLLVHEKGDRDALQRLRSQLGNDVSQELVRSNLFRRLDELPPADRPEGAPGIVHIRRIVAKEVGFESWPAFVEALNVCKLTPLRNASSRTFIPPGDASAVMLQPRELGVPLPMELQGGLYSTTTDVWNMLLASRLGDLQQVENLVEVNPGLIRCEYNYMPPLHLAVREGHLELVRYLLEHGAFDPGHVTYPYNETLLTMAKDRDFTEIAVLLETYARDHRSAGPEGKSIHGAGDIDFSADSAYGDRAKLEKLVAADATSAVDALLQSQPELGHDEMAFGAEGILSMPANRRRRRMLQLLIDRGARVPDVAKWGRAYYFKHYEIGAFLLERGMNPNHMNWHRTTLLHDMAWEGDVRKAKLLLDHGADINAVDDEFRSTPLAVAARFGQREVSRMLLERGADPNRAAASWATPLAWACKKGFPDIESDLKKAGAY